MGNGYKVVIGICILAVCLSLYEVYGGEVNTVGSYTIRGKAFELGDTTIVHTGNGSNIMATKDKFVLLVEDWNGDQDLLSVERNTYLYVRTENNYVFKCYFGGVSKNRQTCQVQK